MHCGLEETSLKERCTKTQEEKTIPRKSICLAFREEVTFSKETGTGLKKTLFEGFDKLNDNEQRTYLMGLVHLLPVKRCRNGTYCMMMQQTANDKLHYCINCLMAMRILSEYVSRHSLIHLRSAHRKLALW